jgi:hypothetical protein
MLNGRVAVFLSCSGKFQKRVAVPIRKALEQRGIRGIIVAEEPFLRGTDDPERKVDSYLEACDVFVALCTPDDLLEDGRFLARQNIIDEYARARTRPKLRERALVFKHPDVALPSNINPTYEHLDVDDVAPVLVAILRQLDAWGIVKAEPHTAPTLVRKPPPSVMELIDGLKLGDWDEAGRRAFELLSAEGRKAAEATVEQLRHFLTGPSSEDNEATLLAGSVLESMHRFDPLLVSAELIEELSSSDDFSTRSIAAHLLWDRAEVAPGDVPLGLLGKLALPSEEDWYVQAPAMAAVKALLLRRRSTRIIFDKLAASEDPEDRYAVAGALLDVAQIDRWAAPRDLAEKLSKDNNELVSAKGREVLEAIGPFGKDDLDPLSPFGL